MEVSLVNNKGKTEKNKRIKSGKCIFPFKYKGQIHNECLDTANGQICATEINTKNGIMTKYGYCPSLKKGTEKKARKPYTRKTIKVKTPIKTPSPIKVKAKKQTAFPKCWI